MIDALVYMGLGAFVAIALLIFLLCRERKSKTTELGPRALAAEFQKQREDRNA